MMKKNLWLYITIINIICFPLIFISVGIKLFGIFLLIEPMAIISVVICIVSILFAIKSYKDNEISKSMKTFIIMVNSLYAAFTLSVSILSIILILNE